MRASLIVAAGGSGERFKNGLANAKSSFSGASKLFFPLAGRPLLAHSLEAFQKFSQIRETLLAVPPDSQPQIQDLIRKAKWNKIRCIAGGKTRAESVLKALEKTDPKNEWVMVHDGARPFVSEKALEKILKSCDKADGVILAKKVVPTIKECDERGWVRRTVDRSSLFEAETPQLVRRSVLKKAYRENSNWLQATDEASLLESIGAKVKVVTHEDWNPKITIFRDLELAEAFLRKGAVVTRNGFGRDTHRLVAGRKLWLGGVHIPFEKGALGHSDGDALLHAVTDAILGAIGAGDIGEWFSDKNPKFKNIQSGKILRAVLDEALKRGWQPEHVDTVIILERPKLGPIKKKIQSSLAALLGLEEEAVSIKAKTAEGLGPQGEGHAISSEALITLKRKFS